MPSATTVSMISFFKKTFHLKKKKYQQDITKEKRLEKHD